MSGLWRREKSVSLVMGMCEVWSLVERVVPSFCACFEHAVVSCELTVMQRHVTNMENGMFLRHRAATV